MTRQVALVALALVASLTSQAAQEASTRGLLIVAIEKGSAPDFAGLKTGDQILSWTRAASSVAPSSRGEFVTPFDAREFEIEQLPRGGTTIALVRDGSRLEMRLIPGFWGIEVRPVFSKADLAIYEAGRAQLEKRPAEALATWQPLIDRFAVSGDFGSAAWLMTHVASSLVAIEQLRSADALFDRAAGWFKAPANPGYEAMVWEAKGNAYHPENLGPRPIDGTGDEPPKLIAAFAAHEQARSLRLRADNGTRTLAAAESELAAGHATVRAAPYFFSAARADGRATFQRIEQFFGNVLDVTAELAPESFARARALIRMGNFVGIARGPYGSNATTTVREADAARRVYQEQAWRIFDAVAPTHSSLRSALGTLAAPVSGLATDDPALFEKVLRRTILFGQQTSDRALVETTTMRLASELAKRGDFSAALSLPDELLRTGSSYSSLANGFSNLASALNSRGHRDVAISILSKVLDGTSPPNIQVALNLALYQVTGGNRTAAERTLTGVLARADSARLRPTERVSLFDRLIFYASGRGDFAAAESWAQRALVEIKAVSPPDPHLVAARYDALERVENDRLNHEKARAYLQLGIEQGRLGRNPTPGQAIAQVNRLLRESPTSPEAEAYFADELARRRKSTPGTVLEATALATFATRQFARGDLEGAERSLVEALDLRRRLEPGSENLVIVLSRLGDLARRLGDTPKALTYYEEALALREAGRLRSVNAAGASMAEGVGFAVEPYVNVAGLLIAGGDFAAAFNVAERARGSSLIHMLKSRDMRDTASIPPALRDQVLQIESEYDRKQRDLEGLSVAKDAVAIAQAQEDLRKLWSLLTDADRRATELNPRAAALDHPVAASLTDVRARLDSGTVLLSYLTGASTTFLFVVTPAIDTRPGESGVVAYVLPVGAGELRAHINAFRTLIGWDADPQGSDRGQMLNRARALYDTLVRPAQNQIARAERILLCVDGPLAALPFGALAGDSTGWRLLAQWKPLHTTPSMSVYLEMVSLRRPVSTTGALVAFGDPGSAPAIQASATTDVEVESLLRSGGSLPPLRGARREVSSIASLFGSRATTYLGGSATEPQAKALNKTAQYIHFAVHGRLNETLPMNSALVFATPAGSSTGDNGVLQAWEIFKHVRIDADLVTLSACDSGLGKEVAGEGILGLTRAFLYAGARTVAASLWKVADEPTAELMTRFYTNLRAGQPKDQALRNAQLDLIRQGRQPGSRVDYSSPAHWASFTLTGDWK